MPSRRSTLTFRGSRRRLRRIRFRDNWTKEMWLLVAFVLALLLLLFPWFVHHPIT